jgi:glucose/arabinose dehydrogenase
MRMGRLAVALVVLLLAAACDMGSDEPAGAPDVSTGAAEEPTQSTETETETETEERPALPTPRNPGPPGNGGLLELRTVAAGLDLPVFATAAPGERNRLYVVEQPGRIRVLQDGKLREQPFLDITSRVASGGERGLLSVAFHPDYKSNGLFYVDYTDLEGDTRVVEYRAESPDREPAEVRELLYVPQPYANHNGGQLVFGPDGLLYVGMGDGGSGGDPENRAQDLSSRLGKLLRLDVDGTSTNWELAAYGLRNPWRFSFDRATGDLWIGDVGQTNLEEIDFVPVTDLNELHNFGWDVFEGSEVYEDKMLTPDGALVEPISEYTHDFGCSVTGGYVYRGRDVRKRAWGRYFFGDYCSGRVWSLARSNGEVNRRGHPFRVPGLTSFAEDAAGELYLLTHDGVIRRLVPRS